MSRTRSTTIERIHATAIVAASVAQAATLTERLGVFGLYEAICFAPAPHLLDEYVEMAARERALLRADRVDWDTVARLRADIEAAKSAAQADYTTRILSALQEDKP